MTADAACPLFVMGSPRSGTTLIGSYLGSSPEVLGMGEYGGFHAAYTIVPSALGAIPGAFRDLYLADLVVHARQFAEHVAAQRRQSWYLDGTPWNLLAARRLAEDLPGALFVLTLRHYSGVVQSLRRSFESGYGWAGPGWDDSARVWTSCYAHAAELPADRLVVVSYEGLMHDPGATLEQLRSDIEGHGFDTSALDLRTLMVSHASPGSGPRPTIAELDGDEVRLQPAPSFDATTWSGDIHRLVWPEVRHVHGELRQRFGEAYRIPPKPAELRVHHDIQGSVPAQLDDW